jgi:hypothetical protein
MPATILPFERREAPRGPTADAEPPPPPLTAFRPPSRPTSQQIAHRWAMLSHLRRHFPRRLPDPVR